MRLLRYGLLPLALLLCWPAASAQPRNLESAFNWGTALPFNNAPEGTGNTGGPETAPAATTESVPAAPVEAVPAPHPKPLALKGQGALYRAAYMDTYRILTAPGDCRTFFGGAVAVEAFNDLSTQLRTKPLENRGIGMMMAGETRNVILNTTGRAYRLFERATLNSRGAFFHERLTPLGAIVPHVGSFAPNTREARVLMLLHELGHLIRQRDGQWLIPNDGGDVELSTRNTALVEQVCGREIKALGDDK